MWRRRPTMSTQSLSAYRRRVFRFVLVFCVLGAASSGAETWMFAGRHGAGYQRMLARVTSDACAGLGVRSWLESAQGQPTIVVGGLRLAVTTECAAILPTGLFVSAVVAFPCGWRVRCVGAALGVIGVALLNLFRLIVLVLVASHRAEWFAPIHDVLMQGFLLVLVAPLWLVWLGWAVKSVRTGGWRGGRRDGGEA